MTVKEFLKAAGISSTQSLTFIIEEQVKDESSFSYRSSYRTTPIRSVYEWLDSKTANYIVLNPKQPPIETITTKFWFDRFNSGFLMCMLVTPEEEIRKQYSSTQAPEMINMYDEEVRAALNDFNN